MTNADSIAELKARGLNEAKRAAKGNTALARALGGEITSQAVAQWRQVPATRVLDVERVTGVPRHVIRPDIFPAPEGEGDA